MLEIYSEDNEKMAWADQWVREEIDGQGLVAIPRLCLSYEAGMDLCARQSYAKVFTEARIHIDDETFGLHVVHAEFPLYATGEAVLVRTCFALVPAGEKLNLDTLFKLIKRGAELLRDQEESA